MVFENKSWLFHIKLISKNSAHLLLLESERVASIKSFPGITAAKPAKMKRKQAGGKNGNWAGFRDCRGAVRKSVECIIFKLVIWLFVL